MSCRYWSKAPEGFARKNAFALPPFDRAIARAPTVDGDDVGESASGAQYRNHAAAVQIAAVFHITNYENCGWFRDLSTIHTAVEKLAWITRSQQGVHPSGSVWRVWTLLVSC